MFRAPTRWPLGRQTLRIQVVLVLSAVVLSIFAGRLLSLQAFDSGGDAAAAAAKLQNTVELLAQRGGLFDAEGAPLATNEQAFAITADPTMTNPLDEQGNPDPKKNKVQQIALVLAKHLGKTPQDYLPLLTRTGTRFVYVAKKVPAATYAAIQADLGAIGAVGIFKESDPIRNYPNGTLAANLIGFVGHDGAGKAGLEYALNAQLAGTPGRLSYERAPDGSRIPLGTSVVSPAVDGNSYRLTINAELQFMAEQALTARLQEVKAASGIVLVMNIKTGEVLAMAAGPGYDLNNPGSAKPANTGNRAVQMAYEPGSVQKILTLAAVIDAGLATADTKVVVPPSLASGGGRIKDVWDHGTIHLTTRGVAAMSSNIGTILLAQQMKTEDLYDKLRLFGLGQRTGIELPGEATGSLPKRDMPSYSRDQIAFGQGLSVTAIQEAAAIAGILNGGMYNTPTILKSATDAAGNPVPLTRPEPRRIVSAETSATMASMLEGILYDKAHRDALGLENYRTGGKTGTAQRYNSDCGCYRGRTTSYAGYAPAEDPQILTYVVLDDVVNGNSGMGTAGPVFQDVTNFALAHFGILPSTTKAPDGAINW